MPGVLKSQTEIYYTAESPTLAIAIAPDIVTGQLVGRFYWVGTRHHYCALRREFQRDLANQMTSHWVTPENYQDYLRQGKWVPSA